MQPPGGDAAIARLAGRQYGVVARRQLVALGLGGDAIDGRLASGRLHAVHRGVFAVGHRAVSQEGRWLAAVLAGGQDALLSHNSAAALWELRPARRGPVEVAAPRALRSRTDLRFHRLALSEVERTSHRGIPVTTAARTLLDLAASLRRYELERAVEEAERRRLLDRVVLAALFDEHPRTKGIAILRAVLEDASPRLTRSDFEARFAAFLAHAGLPAAHLNARVRVGRHRFEVDCVWPEQRVVVELDSHAYHGTRAAFERDRRRDRLLQAAGWRVVRVTWRQLRDEPESVARDIRRLLADQVAVDRHMGG
ncbi:MAG: hypothetical protein QOE65_1102 [Solirubrobacteraceae bacterium]|nr:hypothetical protein [Solirubrobacteraceae bacterium]